MVPNNKDPVINNNGCWCPSDVRNQGISSHGGVQSKLRISISGYQFQYQDISFCIKISVSVSGYQLQYQDNNFGIRISTYMYEHYIMFICYNFLYLDPIITSYNDSSHCKLGQWWHRTGLILTILTQLWPRSGKVPGKYKVLVLFKGTYCKVVDGVTSPLWNNGFATSGALYIMSLG